MSVNTTIPGGLTEPQKQFFHEEGYLVLHDLFTDADLQPAIDDITAQIDREAKSLVETGQLSSAFAEAEFLVRSTARPDQTLRTAEQFAELRATHKPTPATNRWGRWWEGEANRAMDKEQA